MRVGLRWRCCISLPVCFRGLDYVYHILVVNSATLSSADISGLRNLVSFLL